MSNSDSDNTIKILVTIIGSVFVVLILKELASIFIPLVIAYLLYFLFEPLNRYLVSKKIPRALTVVFDIFIVTIIIFSFYRIILGSFQAFEGQLPIYQQKLSYLISGTAKSLGFEDPAITEFSIGKLLKNIDYGGIASGFFSSTLSIVSSGFFILLFFVFVSSGHEKFYCALKKRFDESPDVPDHERTDKVKDTYNDISNKVQKYITAKFLISLASGLFVGIILWIFNVDFLIVLVVLSILLNFIPNIGSFISVSFAALMVLVQYESFGKAALVAVLITVIQNLIGNAIEPKILGDRLGLNPLVILLSLLIWGYIWGIVGMFLAVPLTAVLKIIIDNSHSKNMKLLSGLMEN